MKIRAAVMPELRGRFELQEVELAEPEFGQVLVKIAACGVCHTDELTRNGAFPLPFPAVLGHEGSGIVEKVGPGVDGIKAGDHVVMSFPSCGSCINCRSGRPNLCVRTPELCFEGRFKNGKTPLSKDGRPVSNFFGQSSFATYAVADASGVVVVDKDVDLRLLGPLGCGLLTGSGVVINGFHPYPGESIAIFGAGGVGLSAAMAAKVCGCTKIILVDVVPSRLEKARKLGATHTINSREVGDVIGEIVRITGGGADYALDTTGVLVCVESAAKGLRWGGRLGTVSEMDNVLIDNLALWLAGKRWDHFVEGDAVPQIFIPRLIELYKAGMFPINELIEFFPLDKIEDAFEASHSGRVVKPVLVME